MKKKLVITSVLLLLSVVLFGCLNQQTTEKDNSNNLTEYDEKEYEYDQSAPKLSTKDQLEKFYEAGCKTATAYNNTYLNCESAKDVLKFECKYFNLMPISKEGEEINVLLVKCYKDATQINENEWNSYFSCGGGLSPVCTTYITWENGKFITIRNSIALLKRISPIDSEEKATNYVAIAKNAGKTYKVNEKTFNGKVEKQGSNFNVALIKADSGYGCYSKRNYYEVQYEVNPNGTITEKATNAIYTEELGYTICAD